jgi:signal transduction histidine kinase
MTLAADQPPLARTALDSRGMSPADLAQLIGAFNDVTAKLQRSHEVLSGEVARLTRELKQANDEIERSKRLAALGEMAAGIAHEVRNPLGSIRLYARMLEQDLPEPAPEHATACKISRAAAAIEAIVGDVLMFAKEFRLHAEPLDAGDLFARAVEACAPRSVPDWSALRVTIDAGDAPPLLADPALAQQALVNVVRNAMEAMSEHGVREGVLTLRAEPRDDAGVALVVRDEGPGVAPDTIARMFNPFFTTRSAGTGLGLAIVHRIMDAHAGSVRVRNTKDTPGATADAPGATVELVFPAASQADAPVVTTARPKHTEKSDANRSRCR